MAQQWNKAYSKTLGGKVSKKLGMADPFQQMIRDTAEYADSEDDRIKSERAAFNKRQQHEINDSLLIQKEKKQRANPSGLQTGTVNNNKSLLR